MKTPNMLSQELMNSAELRSQILPPANANNLKAPENEHIFSKYSWNLIKNIILIRFWRAAWNFLNKCLRIFVFMYVYV